MTPTPEPMCPRCGETTLIERINQQWFCAVCSYAWAVMRVQTVGIFRVLPPQK